MLFTRTAGAAPYTNCDFYCKTMTALLKTRSKEQKTDHNAALVHSPFSQMGAKSFFAQTKPTCLVFFGLTAAC